MDRMSTMFSFKKGAAPQNERAPTESQTMKPNTAMSSINGLPQAEVITEK